MKMSIPALENELEPMSGNMQEIREILLRNTPWTPRDFIRELPAERDRATYVEQLTRKLTEENDLRFIYHFPGGERLAIFAERLPWDSQFFGYDVARLNGMFLLESNLKASCYSYRDAVHLLLSYVRNCGIKYLFAPVDPRDLATMYALSELGFLLIETRSYYHMSLKNYSYKGRFSCRTAGPADVESLGLTAQTMVNQYDRFHSDPFIDSADADRLMYRWVAASILDGFADATIVPSQPTPTAFCTVKYNKEHWDSWGLKLAQPVFSAVSNEMRGWYLKIISEVNYHLLDIGAEHSFLSTQVTNRAVIRVWERLGYSFGKCEHIFRIVL